MKPIIKSPDIPALEKTEMGQLTGGFIEIESINTLENSDNNTGCSGNTGCYDNNKCTSNDSCNGNNECHGNKPRPPFFPLIGCEYISK